MSEKKQKVLFLMTPGRKHLVVELDETYGRRELNVLLKAFRKKLLAGGPPDGSEAKSGRGAGSNGSYDRIVGPGFVIEMLGSRTKTDRL